MKSLFINASIVDYHRYLVLLIIIGIAHRSSSAVVPSRDSVSLYTANDKIAILTGQNFSSIVYESKTAWLIEFYASWCGHCQSYANTYREVGIDTLGWQTVVRIGAINCYADENNAVCEEHSIMAFPTLRLIAPETTMNTSKIIKLTASDAKGVERELIKELDALHRTDKVWPTFTPINRASFEDLYTRVPSSVKLLLVIMEKRDDYTGRQIMLDFSKYYEQLAIFRATTDGKFWHQFRINMTDTPALFVILPNRTAEQINLKQNTNESVGSRNLFNYAIRSYIHQRNCIDNFDDRDLEEIIHRKNVLKNADTMKKSNQDDEVEKNTLPQKVNMVDMETALSYMLRREIPRIKEIQGETYDALIHWLNVLIKYFPGREPVVTYLKQLLSKVNEQSNGLTGKKFRELADINKPNSYLPNNQIKYQYCVGSSPQYRGYPCALWLLFHTLTVSQAQSGAEQMHILEIPTAVKHFIKHFFGCRHCSENFMLETNDMNQLDSRDKYAAVIYLWKIHNHINQRLHGDETEDPKYPKIQFPSESLCSECHSNSKINDNDFNLSNTINFLRQYYSKENIDFTSVDELTISSDNKDDIPARPERKAEIGKYSMIEINNESTQKSGFIRSFLSVFQRFPLYFFIAFMIIIFFARRRYCKGKRKRYTL